MRTPVWLSFAVLSASVFGQQPKAGAPTEVAGIPVNYDDSKAGGYTLPGLLITSDGKAVKDVRTWTNQRRPEILRMFEQLQYGRVPEKFAKPRFEVHEKAAAALNGAAIRSQVTIHFSPSPDGPKADLLIYLPANARGSVPLLLNAGFGANSSAVDDPGIRPGTVWNREKQRVPASQGRAFGRMNVTPLLEKGIGWATVYYGDFDPDFDGGVSLGVRSLFPKPDSDQWGTISAWSWGLSRVLDYLETDSRIDAKRVGLTGVSRLGKTVLWTGARDQRFSLVIASCSGEGGAALGKRIYGETMRHMAVRYGYQFAGNYTKWSERISEYPIDAHMLIALMAPRPLLLQTGTTDGWSDPKGEFLAAVAAEPAYKLFGKRGLETTEMPPPNQMIGHTLSYVMHEGGHGMIPGDWAHFIRFMEANWLQ